MTDSDTLNAIFVKLGDLSTEMSAGHARIEGETKVIAERIESLDARVKIQNGRVTKLENQMGDLTIHARIHDKDAAEDDERSKLVQARVWGLLAGTILLVVGALLGHIL